MSASLILSEFLALGSKMECSLEMKPDHTAVRVALWRALHAEVDQQPLVLEDTLGCKIVGENNWRDRADMGAEFSKPMRASIVGRARFIEDLLEKKVSEGISQYVILGAGLDTFAYRRPELVSNLKVFEVDQPGPQAWKRQRLEDLGFKDLNNVKYVPFTFESEQSWVDRLIENGFDQSKPAVIVSTGVSMYLTEEVNKNIFSQISKLAPGTTFAMTFLLSLDYLILSERMILEFVMAKASEGGTPFLSLFSPEKILKIAKEAGFKKSQYVSADDIYMTYFSNRTDGLRAGQAEAIIVAAT